VEERLPYSSQHLPGHEFRWHERVKNGEMRRHPLSGRGIETLTQPADAGFGFGYADDECGLRHSGIRKLLFEINCRQCAWRDDREEADP
jgi:hypothetical protein